ncbi:hypothetical protein RND81_04G118800 [Saponaria officinalis]|uniref:non-specific serine/threonine protein kinase n=1 Tax=Saponaria officinalis TaxID=3572 RepID=A0AAW1LGX1_SAPOF
MLLKFLLLLLSLPSIVVLCLDVFNDDVLGLIVFKAGLLDPHSKLLSWNDSDDTPCKWVGVKCDPNSNKVTEINLDNFSLSGQISPSLLRLQNLQKISLSGNNFTGGINPGFANLWNLQSVDLSGNSLSGLIPDELFQQCGSLKSISFANNMLSGEIPVTFGKCMTLIYANFSGNRISGELPSNIWSLSGLETLDLSNNKLEGEISEEFGSMFSLKVINLGKNAFSGELPRNIGSIVDLQSVDFSENAFSGLIPESLQRLNKCMSVNLSGNSLSGEVPDFIGHMQSLERLDLSKNRFFGKLPFTLGNVRSLKMLNVSSNGFVGGLPQSLLNCDNLVSVDVSLNMLKGKMPNWVFGLGLESFSISGNKFKGSVEFPPLRTNAPSYNSLNVLDLSSNELSGVIGDEIGGFKSLKLLNLSNNLFIGLIPTNLGDLNMTQVVDLSHNKLSGSIPSQVEKCTYLTTINLSNNNLTGSIPSTIGHLTNLEVIDLSHNNLSGNLPKELTDLSHLVTFNISDNNFEGELPAGGFFDTIPVSSLNGNPSLCGSVVNQSCPAVHPKPIVLNPNSSTESPDDNYPSNSRHKKLMLSISALIAIGAASFIFVGVVIITILNVHVRKSADRSALPLAFTARGDEFSHSPTSDSQYGKLVMFSGEADFGSGAHALLNKDTELGRGGFGIVYHTVLGDGRSVAIKKLSISSLIKSQEEFEREIKNLGKVRHDNLIELEGYYWTPSLQLLINEYVPNASLFKHLHGDSSKTALSWHQRFGIIVGMAKGLAHLHQNNIIHYNLKSSNVLLDNSCEPKVGDFGLARLLPMLDRYLLSSKIQSALGYMAPEFACRTVKITEKCDVYGFGILVLEVITGKKPVEYMEDDVVVLCDMVRGALEEGKAEDCIDQRLHGNFVVEEVIPVIKLGLICASQVPSNRPDMAEVVNILELIQCPSEGREDELE